MPRASRLLLEDILRAIGRIAEEAAGAAAADIAANVQLQETVLWNLHVIGEAAKHVPDNVRGTYTEVDWKHLAALRDKIVHAYFGIKWEIIEDTIRNKLPVAEQQLRSILAALPPEIE